MTFQEILEGITRHRANPMAADVLSEIGRKISEIEWALQALAETLRDREQELSAIAPHERAGHGSDALDEVDVAFKDFEKRFQDEKRE